MNIVHLNTYTKKENITFPHIQIHHGLLEKGHDSRIYSLQGDLKEEKIYYLRNKGIKKFSISKVVRKIIFEKVFGNKDVYFFPEWNLDYIRIKELDFDKEFHPDIIITYWTKFSFNQKFIYKLSKMYKSPVICYMMDMAPLTGGCHYSFGCDRYQKECGKCHAIKSKNRKDISFRTLKTKKKYVKKTNINYIACSDSLAKQSEKSSLLKNKKIFRTMLGIKSEVFCPVDKNMAKKKLNIDLRKKIIFFGSTSIKEKRKGFSLLLEALKIIYEMKNKNFENEDILLLIAGNNLENEKLFFEAKYLGYLKTEEELALAYQVSDVFVCPSIEDSGPLMISQAVMSGCPVVSFDMGIAPDLIINKLTGFRVEPSNINELVKGIINILSIEENEWRAISKNCRELALKKCSLEVAINEFEQILNEVRNSEENYENNTCGG